jgi:hypothetical protein
MTLKFQVKYLILTLILLAIEVFIALFAKDDFIRPFVGDLLVVILIYCFFRIFLEISYWKLAVGVFLFACLVELLQYFHYAERLGFGNNRVMKILLGTTFQWSDFLAYFCGFLVIILAEIFFDKKRV